MTGSSRTPSWTTYRDSIGDRSELFRVLSAQWSPQKALYLGSYLDLSPSTAIGSVTYVDTDRRAARYFADSALVASELQEGKLPGAGMEIKFIQSDFTQDLPLPRASFDLVISLYTGPAWDGCRQYLAPNGLFLANASHGDASLAALDPSLRLEAAIIARDSRYRLDTENLDRYLIPKRPAAADPDTIRRQGRGIAYTKPAFAYLFRSVGSEA